jgi:hypothetical protein
MKQSERQKTLSVFQKLRRLQETDEYGNCRCISCGKLFFWKDGDGGHYITRECRATELDADNVWPQCKACNRFKSGNGTLYQYALFKKIGIIRTMRLESLLLASKGNEDIIKELSNEDKRLIIQKKNDEEYKKLRKGFMSEIRAILKYKGI